jgi:segregation and condensation protein B
MDDDSYNDLSSVIFHPSSNNINMELSSLIPHIEALIFASDKPLAIPEIVDLLNSTFGFEDEADKMSEEQVNTGLQGIVEKYNSEFYPFEVRESGGGWQFLTKREYHKTVAQLNGEKFLKRLSAAALETLAIIAYKQPVTKGEIEIIRGVSADYTIQKLLEKELIVITGRNEQLPGHPLVYETSKTFMDYFGINSPEDLPKLKEVLPDQIVEPTPVHHTEFEQSERLAISDAGELIDNIEIDGARLYLATEEQGRPVEEDAASIIDEAFDDQSSGENEGSGGNPNPSVDSDEDIQEENDEHESDNKE